MYYITEADIMWCDGCPVCVLEAAEVEELIAQTHHTNKKSKLILTYFSSLCVIFLIDWFAHFTSLCQCELYRWSKAPVQINYAHRQFRGGEALTKKPRSHRTDRVLLLAASRSQTRIEPDCDPATTCSSDTLKWIDSTGFLWPVRLWEETQSKQTSSPKTAPRSFLKNSKHRLYIKC